MTTVPADLVQATVRFCRALRMRGLATTPAATLDALRTLERVDLADRTETYLALRAVLTKRVEDLSIFDVAFNEYFRAGAARRETDSSDRPPRRNASVRQGGEATIEQWTPPGAAAEDDLLALPAFGTSEAKRRKDFSRFSAEGMEDVVRVARQMARRLATRRSRRWQPARRGTHVHARRTLRRVLATGGDPLELAFRRRRIRKARLVVLCDVSGSMDIYSRFLLQFLYAMQGAFARVESFIFSTRLARVTEHLGTMTFAQALDRLADVRGFSGGTRIGECLAEFEKERAADLVDRFTIVVILSDGWDTGEPAVLGGAMRRIHRRAGRVIWLNPLLGSPAYRPLTRGMQAALPHVDVFAAAHDLESLRAMARHLDV